jgi:dipeptidyl aminopeptidase/acylaminoacyl peptidase
MIASAPMTIDDILSLKQVGNPELSPDRRNVSYVVADAALEVGAPAPESRIWIVSVAGDAARPVTAGPGSDVQPSWSPDGTMLAFRSDREERGTWQVYLLGPLGEARKLSDFPGGVSNIAWSPDGGRIAAVVRDAKPERAEGADHLLYEDEPRYERVWLIDVTSGAARQVTTADEQIWEFCWSPDGTALAAIASARPERWSWYRSRLVCIDLADGTVTTLHTPDRQLARPSWSPDAKQIAVVTSIFSDPGMTGGDVLLVSATTGETRRLQGNDARSHLSLHWEADSRSLITSAIEQGEASVSQVTLDGATETLWRDRSSFASYGMSALPGATLIAATIATPNAPAEVWVGEVGADVSWRQLTHHNDEFVGRIPGVAEPIHWTAADGLEIQGLLVRPTSVARDQPLPMVTMIHGGPTALSGYAYPAQGVAAWLPELVRRGVAVFFPNARGSAGWGLAFSEANQRDLGGADLQDILSGIDACVERGIADPDRLGVCGWSYGGYLTAWIVTQTDRFKTAIAGASITNWLSFHGTSDIPAFDEFFYRADPLDVAGPYVRFSPIYSVNSVTTPVLFLHGERDAVCPVGQAKEMFRALHERGVETECVIYPREGHPIRERAHRRDMFERGISWLCRGLGCDDV